MGIFKEQLEILKQQNIIELLKQKNKYMILLHHLFLEELDGNSYHMVNP